MGSIAEGLKRVEIDLPMPHRALHPNGGSRHNFHKINRLKKSARQTAYYIAFAALNRADPPRWRKAKLTLHFYFERSNNRGRRDKDNLIAWCKHHLDGIADAQIVYDDRAFLVPEVIEDHDKAHPRLIVTVEGIE